MTPLAAAQAALRISRLIRHGTIDSEEQLREACSVVFVMVRGLAQKRCRHMFESLFGDGDFVFDWEMQTENTELPIRKRLVAQLTKQYLNILAMLGRWIGSIEAADIIREIKSCLGLVRVCVHLARGRIVD